MTKKPTVTTLQSGFNSTETLNTNFEALRDGFDNTLSLDGSTPNAMEADLDLNGNNIIGATGLLINGTDYLADVTAAKTAAQAAQAAAETAETNAETAETNAESSETAAGLSATAAASSASAADSSSKIAAASAAASETAETNAETAESNASTSATNAATSETNASTSASTASTKAAEAATSATNAATSATEAETAKTGAETARDAALAALDSFDDRYLGVKTSDPTVDNDGDALVVGALYFNSTTDKLYVYDGSSWQVTTSGAAAGDLVSTNNLSDLTNAATARTNLGLGTAATTASTDYATAAQGTLADTATQPADLATVATTGGYSDLTGKPTLGTAAATASTDYATAAQGTLADSAVQPNDSPTFEGLTIDKTSGDTTVTIRTTGTGDADATLVLDSADTGESAVQFEHDGVYGAQIQWYTDGSPDLNITTVGATSVIDLQPNNSLSLRVTDSEVIAYEPFDPQGGIKSSYDSGWVSVSNNNSYDFTHNLGVTGDQMLLMVFVRDESNRIFQIPSGYSNSTSNEVGPSIYHKSTNVVQIATGNDGIYSYDNTELSSTVTRLTSGSYRIKIMKWL